MESDENCILVNLKSKSASRMNTSIEEVDEDGDQGEESVGTVSPVEMRVKACQDICDSDTLAKGKLQ